MIGCQYRNWIINFNESTEKWEAYDAYGWGGQLQNHSLKLLKEEIDGMVSKQPRVLTLIDGRYQSVQVAKFFRDGGAAYEAFAMDGECRSHRLPKYGHYPETEENLRRVTVLNTLLDQVEKISADIEKLTEELQQSLLANTATANVQTNN